MSNPFLKKDSVGYFIQHEFGDLRPDFLVGPNYLRPIKKGKEELIAKAMGIQKGFGHVWDLTAGLLEDSVFLARLGFHVLALERNSTIFEVMNSSLQSSLKKIANSPVDSNRFKYLHNISLENTDSIEFLSKNVCPPGCSIYIDPMFPDKKKSALPRKEMRIFKEIVGADEDGLKLLEVSLQSGCKRVIVKRPLKAAPLIEKVNHSFKGTSIRYDLYLKT